ncbi:hypothetical protein JX265_012408 [Neoarthrinium moseri]|uniref:DNA-directed RNA polymerase III subunit n=1 Tax=Neoarthrinium moseri TaxID=1658444 RepID=A0A9P9WAE2_9PEZI|nr:uncharacterized protein JN550_013665 [Neoarthrinium moseri]KAI1851510.1 hypothetical protein JX266_002972 [Neoarthrinium moseri]KAI1855053.1 hypothetical protein JX265_012408 [Neoarthrinium moseri]KAI1856725.1 hypothetical protein JN550_013665 [Neoarthrinium moseri]
MAARGGGRGGGRGGRGGARGGGKSGLPWEYDPNPTLDQPQETYPKTYRPPLASAHPLTPSEARAVRYLVKFRRDFHNSGLYTHRHLAPESVSASDDFSDPVSKAYGQQQVNDRYGVKNKATIDPFLSVPMYTHQFVAETRTMPDLRGHPFHHDFFPEELWNTLDNKDGGPKGPIRKRKSMAVDEDPFALDDDDDLDESGQRKKPMTDEERRRRIEEAATGKEADDDIADEDAEDEDGDMSQQDDDFEDDEDGGDYNAEQYFDGGDDDLEDEGGGEAAMD